LTLAASKKFSYCLPKKQWRINMARRPHQAAIRPNQTARNGVIPPVIPAVNASSYPNLSLMAEAASSNAIVSNMFSGFMSENARLIGVLLYGATNFIGATDQRSIDLATGYIIGETVTTTLCDLLKISFYHSAMIAPLVLYTLGKLMAIMNNAHINDFYVVNMHGQRERTILPKLATCFRDAALAIGITAMLQPTSSQLQLCATVPGILIGLLHAITNPDVNTLKRAMISAAPAVTAGYILEIAVRLTNLELMPKIAFFMMGLLAQAAFRLKEEYVGQVMPNWIARRFEIVPDTRDLTAPVA
jgi:hypothetical protein